MGRCIADCTKDRLVLNKADTEKYRLQHKNKKGLIVAQTRSNAFVTDMIYIALSAKNTPNMMFRCGVKFLFVRVLCGWFSDSNRKEAREFGHVMIAD